MQSILLIDDSADFRDVFSEILANQDYAVWTASSTEEAFKILGETSVDLIVCDLYLPFTTSTQMFDYVYGYEVGVRTIKELRWVYPNLPLIMITAAPEFDLPRLTQDIPKLPTLSKTFTRHELVEVIESELAKSKQSSTLRTLH